MAKIGGIGGGNAGNPSIGGVPQDGDDGGDGGNGGNALELPASSENILVRVRSTNSELFGGGGGGGVAAAEVKDLVFKLLDVLTDLTLDVLTEMVVLVLVVLPTLDLMHGLSVTTLVQPQLLVVLLVMAVQAVLALGTDRQELMVN